eukprot:gene10116-7212_t
MDVLDQMIAENARFMEHEESESEDSAHSSGNNSSSSGGSTSSSTLVPDDFRTPYSTRRGKIPKLLKHDIRRFYPAMFINVLNSQDGGLLTRYFDRFHLPQSNLKLLPDLATCWTVTNKEALDASGRVHGRASVVNYFNVMFQSYPDLVFTLQDVELTRCNYSHKCRLNLRMRIQWTEMKPVLAGGCSSSTSEGVNVDVDGDDIDSIDVEPRVSISSATSDSGDSHSSHSSGSSSSGSSCALPPMMQHEIEQLMEKARLEAQSKRPPATTEVRCDPSTEERNGLGAASSSSSSSFASNEQPPIVWEKFAYEIFADVPFELDEEWYITQIDSCTLSRSLQKLNLSSDD